MIPARRRRWRAAPLAVAMSVGMLGCSVPPPAMDVVAEPREVVTTSEPTAPPVTVVPVVEEAVAIAAPVLAAPRAPVAGPVEIAFLGDSVAWSTAAAIAPFAAAHDVSVVNEGIWGCGAVRGTPFRYFGTTYDVIPNDCDHWPEQWQAAIDRDAPDVAVVMVGRWELMDRVHDGSWTHIGDPVFDAYVGSELDRAVAVAGSRGARVVVATTPYYRRGDAPGGGTWPEDEPARVDLVNALLRGVAARHPGVGVIEFGALLSPEGHLAMEISGVRIRTDGVHIATSAGPWMAPQLLPAIRAAAGL